MATVNGPEREGSAFVGGCCGGTSDCCGEVKAESSWDEVEVALTIEGSTTVDAGGEGGAIVAVVASVDSASTNASSAAAFVVDCLEDPIAILDQERYCKDPSVDIGAGIAALGAIAVNVVEEATFNGLSVEGALVLSCARLCDGFFLPV